MADDEGLRGIGFEMGRLKTGTPPRLDRESIDLARWRDHGWTEEPGDAEPEPFSFTTTSRPRPVWPIHKPSGMPINAARSSVTPA